MEAYKTWVRRNKDYVHSLESLANVKEFLLFSWDLKTLVEVAAIHYCGEGKKWNFIAFTEAAKVLVRLALFWNTAYKMLLHGGETPNTETNMDFSGSQQGPGSSSKLKGHIGPAHLCTFNGQNQWNLERRARSSLSRFGENARMVSDPVWLHRVQRQHAIMEPPSPAVPRPTLSMILSEKGICRALFVMGELLFIMRPLIYVLFIRKYGMQSWIPWFLSLGVDFIGAGVLAQFMKTGYGGKCPKFHLTVSEQDEVQLPRNYVLILECICLINLMNESVNLLLNFNCSAE